MSNRRTAPTNGRGPQDCANHTEQGAREPADQGWGQLAAIRLPSGAELPLYEPRHPVAHAAGG